MVTEKNCSDKYGSDKRSFGRYENVSAVMRPMLNFAVGPVMSTDIVKEIGSLDVPYFRTSEFSALMLQNEEIMLDLSYAPAGSRVAFMTSSGTGAMEASVLNTLTERDRVLLVNGGGFGARFAEILSLHGVPFEEIRPASEGLGISEADLAPFDGKSFTAFVVNLHETSTGVLYDLSIIGDFCRRNRLFLIVDAISSFLADEIHMDDAGIDVLITGSQKALALPPGASIIVLSPDALERVGASKRKCMYLDLKTALKDGERGQTPFTPAVGTLVQMNARLNEIRNAGGAVSEIRITAARAAYFRARIKDLPFEMFSKSPSNAVTSLEVKTENAHAIFETMKDEYGIYICPNGGELRDRVFRVGHIGNLSFENYDTLISAFRDMQKRGLI